MTEPDPRPHRRSLRLPHYDYSQTGAYFVTLCAHNRRCLFGEIVDGNMRVNGFGQTLNAHWQALTHHYPGLTLDAFVVMPNHLHGILVIASEPVGVIHESPGPEPDQHHRRHMLLSKIVGRFKMQTAKAINRLLAQSGTALWQRNYYEHIIRHDDEMNRVREYIANNPLRWAEDAENPQCPDTRINDTRR